MVVTEWSPDTKIGMDKLFTWQSVNRINQWIFIHVSSWSNLLSLIDQIYYEYLYMSVIDLIYYEYLYMSVIDLIYYLNVNFANKNYQYESSNCSHKTKPINNNLLIVHINILKWTLTLVSLHTNYIILTKSINTIIKQDYLLLRRLWKRS